jgi:hypothetical protein
MLLSRTYLFFCDPQSCHIARLPVDLLRVIFQHWLRTRGPTQFSHRHDLRAWLQSGRAREKQLLHVPLESLVQPLEVPVKTRKGVGQRKAGSVLS